MKKVIRVTKEFDFEMAHALYGYDGACKNVHGHSYRLAVTLKGTPLDNPENPKHGMVIDFSDLKKIVKAEVVDVFDHALVLNGDSPHKELKEADFLCERTLLVPYQPTCENMLCDFATKIQKKLPGHVELHCLKLRETSTSLAEWYQEDNK